MDLDIDLDVAWDIEVDVVCTDSGLAGVATAISTARAEGSVFLASAPPTADSTWFGIESGDGPTAEYLHELTADIAVAALPRLDADLPIRASWRPDPPRGRRLPTFDGARLRDWAARCIPSPTGYLYTRVTGWDTVAIQGQDGQALAVSEIGELAPDGADPAGSVRRWLDEQADDVGVFADPVLRWERLIFHEGVVVGAEFATTDGPLTVRARHGVLICRAAGPLDLGGTASVAPDAALRVALVGTVASRFGRVELLTP